MSERTPNPHFRIFWSAVLVLLMLAPAGSQGYEPDPSSAAAKKRFKRSRLTHDMSEGTADRRRLSLTTGEDKTVDLDFPADLRPDGISVGNPQVVAYTLARIGEQRQLVFKPLKAGETSVTVRDTEGNLRVVFTIQVTGSNLLRVAGQIRDLLRDVEGIDIRIVGPKVVVEGQLLVPADYARLLTVIQDKSYSEYVMNMTTLSPLAMDVLAKRIQEDVHAFAQNVTTRVVNGVIFLEGTVENKGQLDRAMQIATIYLPEFRPSDPLAARDQTARMVPNRPLVQSFILINPPPQKKQEKLVRVTVHYVELSKDYNKLFGFKWQPGFTADPQITVGTGAAGGAGAGGAGAGASFTATISSLIPKLQSAQKAGYARILRTATTIVRSGQNAILNEQTQFPHSAQGPNGTVTTASTRVGLAMNVTPLILGQSEDIQLDLDMDQQSLVSTPAAGTAPITAIHRVKTFVYVKSNESAAVGAVTSSDIGTNFNGDDPGAGSFEGNTEPLFSMHRSKNYRKKKSQFVIFVTPQIIESASEGTEDLKKNFRVKVK